MKNLNRLQATTIMAAALTLTVGLAHANPTGGSVAAGAATIVDGGAVMNINQTSDRAVINWNTFNIANGETTNFNQPSANAATLNRIGDANPSQILGNLNANGQVMLVNPNGVFFGNTAQVNVGSLVATTADTTDANFMSGAPVFNKAGNPDASVVNAGSITIADGGMAVLVAPTVTNSGNIVANAGKVALAGSDVFTIDPFGDKLVNFAVSSRTGPKANAATVNQNANIYADAGQIQLTAKAVKGAVDAVVNTTGINQARNVNLVGGKIVLEADTVNMGGTTDVSGKDVGDAGGSINATARKIMTFTGDANASGNGNTNTSNGGTVSVRGSSLVLGGTVNVGSGGNNGTDGTASFHATGGTFHLNDAAVTTLSSAMSHGGTIEIGAPKNILVESALDTTGQGGGATLSIVDTNSDGYLNANVHEKITLAANQSMSGGASKVTIHEDASVQNGVDMAADGATIHVYTGTYDENVTVNKNGLIITGVNAGIPATDMGSRNPESTIVGYVNIGGSNVVFNGFNVDGADLDGAYVGINVHDADNVTVANNLVTDGSVLDNMSGNKVSLLALRPLTIGINLVNATNVDVTNNEVAGFETGVRVKASDFADVTGNGVFAGQYGIDVRNSYLVNVASNNLDGSMTGNGEHGVNIVDAQNSSIHDNGISEFDTGIMATNSDFDNIRDNTITGVDSGIVMKGSNRAFIKNNKITGNGVAGGAGIALVNSDKARVFTNVINSVKDGILVTHSSDANLDRNRVKNVKNGLNANYADRLLATQNTFVGDNTGIGIWIRNSNHVGFATTGNAKTNFLKDEQVLNTSIDF